MRLAETPKSTLTKINIYIVASLHVTNIFQWFKDHCNSKCQLLNLNQQPAAQA